MEIKKKNVFKVLEKLLEKFRAILKIFYPPPSATE